MKKRKEKKDFRSFYNELLFQLILKELSAEHPKIPKK